MAGALLEILSYGVEDIYLTGSPQITFFKIAYRRYTCFAIQTHFQTPDSPLDFEGQASIKLEPYGDLISSAYFVADLPAVNLPKRGMVDSSQGIIKTFLELIDNYLAANFKAARVLESVISATHLNPSHIIRRFNDPTIVDPIRLSGVAVRDYLNQGRLSEAIDYDDVSIYRMLQMVENLNVIRFLTAIYKQSGLDERSRQMMLETLRKKYYLFVKSFRDDILKRMQAAEKRGQDSRHHRFAWAREIGTALIEQTEFHLGGNLIDDQTGEFLSSYEKLFLTQEKAEIYDELIGNVPEIYQYNSLPKPARQLIVPLRFCFTLRPSSALPIIAMKNSPPEISFKIRSLKEICRFSPDLSVEELDLHLGSAKLMVDHIYLSQDEKLRYYKYSQEYLIETVQQAEISDCYGRTINVNLPFVGPIKYLSWWVKPDVDRFFSGPDYLPTQNSVIKMQIHDRVSDRMGSKYYELIQPYFHFAKNVPKGFNAYSFALQPREAQNTGTLNTSRLKGFKIRIDLANEAREPVTAVVFTMGYNVLRFYSGIGGLAFRRSG